MTAQEETQEQKRTGGIAQSSNPNKAPEHHHDMGKQSMDMELMKRIKREMEALKNRATDEWVTGITKIMENERNKKGEEADTQTNPRRAGKMADAEETAQEEECQRKVDANLTEQKSSTKEDEQQSGKATKATNDNTDKAAEIRGESHRWSNNHNKQKRGAER